MTVDCSRMLYLMSKERELSWPPEEPPEGETEHAKQQLFQLVRSELAATLTTPTEKEWLATMTPDHIELFHSGEETYMSLKAAAERAYEDIGSFHFSRGFWFKHGTAERLLERLAWKTRKIIVAVMVIESLDALGIILRTLRGDGSAEGIPLDLRGLVEQLDSPVTQLQVESLRQWYLRVLHDD